MTGYRHNLIYFDLTTINEEFTDTDGNHLQKDSLVDLSIPVAELNSSNLVKGFQH